MTESLLLHRHLRVLAGRVVVTLGIHVTKVLEEDPASISDP
ncbi:hypothetical protein [Kocuria dechangensis]|nr:hypothetical protein [Kocuria dechangensis]